MKVEVEDRGVKASLEFEADPVMWPPFSEVVDIFRSLALAMGFSKDTVDDYIDNGSSGVEK